MVVYNIITVLNNSELGGMSHVAFMRLRQETHKVQASLGYTGRLCLNKTKLGLGGGSTACLVGTMLGV